MAHQRKTKAIMALMLALAISLSATPSALASEADQTVSLASADAGTINYLADEGIAPGIRYTEEDYLNFQDTGRRTRINHMEIDPSVSNLHIIASKAGDTVNALESVETQANREVAKGNNVVATINADTFDMYTNNGGIPTGLMIQNGAIVVSQPNDYYSCCNVPCFFTQEDGSYDIAHLMVQGSISVGSGFQTDVNLINRTNFYNRFAGAARSYESLRIYTSAVNKTHTMKLNSPDSTVADPQLPVSEAYALIEVDNFEGSIFPATAYTGKVKQIYTEQGFNIPDNCIVLAGFNEDSSSVSALKTGDTVAYSCHLYTGEWSGGYNLETNMADGKAQPAGDLQELTDVYTAVSAFHNLAENGVSLVDPNNGYDGKNARTLLGITEDGKLQVVTINESGMMDLSLTDGVTFQEMIAYMLDTLGCKDVINLDSGGSAEMAVRRAGSDDVTQASYPSDGGSRSVTNAILFVSNAERTTEIGSVIVDSSINIYLGSKYQFSVRLTDTNNNALSLGDHSVVWSAQSGSIDKDGNYTAPGETCTDTITATVDGNYIGTATVKVVDDSAINTISLSPSGSLALDMGDVRQFSILAYNSDMQQIIVSNDKAEWSVTDNVGTIDNGKLAITAEYSPEASVSASIFGKTLTTGLIIGIKEQVIENFNSVPVEGFRVQRTNDKTTSYYGGAAGASDWILLNNDDASDNSLKINYIMSSANSNMNIFFRYTEATDLAGNGTWNDTYRADMDARYTAKAMPKKLGMMVYGDNSGNKLYAGVVSGYGTSAPQNMSSLGGITINWTGWKWVEISIPQTYSMPIHFRYLWIQRTNNSGEQSSLRFDDIKFLYTDDSADLSGPEFSGVSPAAGNIYSDTLNFSATVKDSKSAVDAKTLEVKLNGDSVSDFTYDSSTGKLSFNMGSLQDGQDYTVTVSASDVLGNAANPTLSATYHIDTAPDKEAPVINRVTPRDSVYPIQIPRPRINFRVQDAKNAVNASSVKVTLNGKELSVYFDSETGYAYAQPDFDLSAGTSTFTIDASDTVGNAMETYTGSFTVDPIEQPADPNNYTVTVIPDTQGNAFSTAVYGRAADDGSDFVIQMGDIVDVKEQSDYDAAVADISMLKGKPAFVVGGNHEGLNTEAYYDTFNSPTYYFEYGNALYIVLNSMLGQSVSYTDSTQYHWLEDVLSKNTLPNVYVLNHVVTRDDYQTDHNMTDEEADTFEGILSDYKTTHPNYSITVLFGHMHTLHSWQVGGVDYIVTGNGANKTYVTHDQGDLLGTGAITMKNGKTVFGFDPLLTKVYIKNSALYGDKISTVSGAALQLDLYGDFREYPANYLTQINDDALMNITWTSSDPSVASVDNKGTVRILKEGTANIIASSGSKTTSISLKAGVLDDTKLVKLALSLPSKITSGSSFVPTLTATDVNGNQVLLDNSKATFTSQKGLISTNGNGTLRANSAGTDTVNVQYVLTTGKTLTATANTGIEAVYISNGSVDSGSKTVTNADGSTTTTVTDKSTGAVTETTEFPGASKTIKITNKDGSISTTTTTKNGLKTETLHSAAGETTASVTIPKEGEKVVVAIPVKDLGSATVAVIVHSDGTEKIVRKSVLEGDKLLISLDSSVKLKIVEKKTEFSDISSDEWYSDSVDFVISHELFKGTSEELFSPNESMTRAMLFTVLYRLDDGTEKGGNSWYSNALDWAVSQNLSDGSSPDAQITRQQMATILYRYAQSAGQKVSANADLTGYSDAENVADYAAEAMRWAVSNSIIIGDGGGKLNPNDFANRAQVAAILLRFEKSILLS